MLEDGSRINLFSNLMSEPSLSSKHESIHGRYFFFLSLFEFLAAVERRTVNKSLSQGLTPRFYLYWALHLFHDNKVPPRDLFINLWNLIVSAQDGEIVDAGGFFPFFLFPGINIVSIKRSLSRGATCLSLWIRRARGMVPWAGRRLL